jgi:hypothetical protein
MNLPDKIYTSKDLDRAKDKAQVVGWLQGGAVVIGGAILWNLLGWVPVLIAIVAVGWVLLKLLSRPKGKGED